jgi:hypothetical protein
LKSDKLPVWGMKAASSRMMRRRECPMDIVGRCLELDQKQETAKSGASIESRLCFLPLSQAEPNDAQSGAQTARRSLVRPLFLKSASVPPSELQVLIQIIDRRCIVGAALLKEANDGF